jgi:hypothetical protein
MGEGQNPRFTHYQPQDSSRSAKVIPSSAPPEKKSEGSTMKSVLSLVLFIGVLYGMSQLASAMEESMQNSMPGSKDPHATDPFDRIFGSEFNTKFKNNSRNKGVLKKEAELKHRAELAKQNFRKKGTTSTVKEVYEHLHGNKDAIVLLQKFASNDIDEGMRYLKTANFDFRRLGPLAFQGFTYREIITEAHEGRNISRLRLASAYILDCLMTNQTQEISISGNVSSNRKK